MAFMVDVFSDPDRGVDYHHKDSYNVVYLDGHVEPLVDKERVIYSFGEDLDGDGIPDPYHIDHVKQDRVWKRYLDISGGKIYPKQ